MPNGFVHTAKHRQSLQQSDLVATARFQHVVGVSANVKREPPRDRKGTNTALNNGGIMDDDFLDMLEELILVAGILMSAGGLSLGLVYWFLPLLGVKI